MVKKHKLISDFEQLIYSPELLQNEWDKISKQFVLIVKGGWTNSAILDFINSIKSSDHAKKFFPGSSMGTLLISKPDNGHLNYQRTLSISFIKEKDMFKMSYSAWDTIDKREDSEKATLWKKEIGVDELEMQFEEFIKWNKNWN